MATLPLTEKCGVLNSFAKRIYRCLWGSSNIGIFSCSTSAFCDLIFTEQNCKFGSHRSCKNFFCITCEPDSLCSREFHEDCTHSRHKCLQVRKCSYRYVVRRDSLTEFNFDMMRIQKYIYGEWGHIHSKQAVHASGPPGCEVCGDVLLTRQGHAPICSLECSHLECSLLKVSSIDERLQRFHMIHTYIA